MAWDGKVCSSHRQRAARELSFLGPQFLWDQQCSGGEMVMFSTAGKSGPSGHLRAVSEIKQLFTFFESLASFCTLTTVLEMVALWLVLFVQEIQVCLKQGDAKMLFPKEWNYFCFHFYPHLNSEKFCQNFCEIVGNLYQWDSETSVSQGMEEQVIESSPH